MNQVLLALSTSLIGPMLLAGCVTNADTWATLDLVSAYTTDSNPDWPYLDAVDQTTSKCGEVVRCVQAVGNSYLTVLKFASVEEAATYAKAAGDNAVQIDPLVVHFNDAALGAEVRQEVVSAVKNIHADSSEE